MHTEANSTLRERRVIMKTLKSVYLLIFVCFIASEKISENIHIFANDPSLAFFRIQVNILNQNKLCKSFKKNAL